MAEIKEPHSDCAPIPPDVKEVLEKGPRGPDGKGLRKVLEYFTSKDPHYVVETRPNKRAQGRDLDCAEGENVPGTKRQTGEESWTKLTKCQLDAKSSIALKDNLDVEKGKTMELHEVKMLNPNVFIGMDVLKRRPVITDKNPHVEGLQDVHKCIYLPSSMDKNQYLPNYLNQNILFMELPSAPLFTPGIAPGLFFATPKLAGCNIFVAHDPAIHKYWVLRISSKNPYLPPDLGKAEMQFTLIFVLIKTFLHVLESCHLYFQFLIEKQREEEAKMKEQEEKEKEKKDEGVKKETTQDKINNLKDKMGRMHRTSNELTKARKQLEELEEIRDTERLLGIEEELKAVPRYGPEAATLKMEQDEIQERIKKRKEVEEEIKNIELKQKTDRAKTNKARDASANDENEKKNSTSRKSSNNLNAAGQVKTETQIKLDKIKERKKMLEEAEKEKYEKSAAGGRHTVCQGSFNSHLGVQMSKKSSFGSRAPNAAGGRKGDKQFGKKDSWRPPKEYLKKHACKDKDLQKKSWVVQFKEFRAYGECVLDYLRSKGMNAHFVLRIATDRDWAADVRAQSFWLEETNRIGKCNHYMYRGEAVFFARFDGGNWKFGLKDLAISSGKTGISTRYPLEGKDYFHANNCDTHNAYHQAMTKGAKMLEKEPKPKPTGDIDHSAGTTTISGVPNKV